MKKNLEYVPGNIAQSLVQVYRYYLLNACKLLIKSKQTYEVKNPSRG